MRRRITFQLPALLFLLLTLASPARAEGLDKKAASLAWTPANIAHYSAWLRADARVHVLHLGGFIQFQTAQRAGSGGGGGTG